MTKYQIPIRYRTRNAIPRSREPLYVERTPLDEATKQASFQELARAGERSVRADEVASSKDCDAVPGAQERRHRVARDQAQAAQEALLVDVLSIADNLERTLSVADESTLIWQGVAIAHSDVMQLLRKHGIERMEAEAPRFDPHWQEAIAVVSAEERGVESGTVVEVMQPGYRRDERLFRPARVVVAQ
jgi:molecular chaperone GrpE